MKERERERGREREKEREMNYENQGRFKKIFSPVKFLLN